MVLESGDDARVIYKLKAKAVHLQQKLKGASKAAVRLATLFLLQAAINVEKCRDLAAKRQLRETTLYLALNRI